jgi:uncharacterized repeat protein (TIGR03803 family)
LDGTGFKTLRNLTGGPRASLLILSNAIYGTTESDGSFGGGTVFKLNTDGSGFTNLQNFASDPGNGPWAGLILASNSLYGTTYASGDFAQGSIFMLNLDGTGFTNLYSFTSGSDGSHPQAALCFFGNTLYGTASEGGSSGDGTIFRLALTPGGTHQLTIVVIGTDAILRWPTNATGLTLQSTTDLRSPITWGVVTPGPVIVNGFNTVTNPVSGAARFYRLSP